MFVLMTRTPCEAGEFETTGISHSSSSAIFHTSLAIRVRSWSVTRTTFRYLSISSRIRAGGVLPLAPALEYHVPVERSQWALPVRREEEGGARSMLSAPHWVSK